MKITFLGTGANGGVPQVDCRCPNCEAAVKHTSLVRKRSSFLIEKDGKKILIDCGPDFWSQMQDMNLKIQDLDLIVITHLHFDHCNGLMELSGGKKWDVPVLTAEVNKNRLLEDPWKSLVERGFVNMVDEDFGKALGVSLVKVPHDPNFPTFGVTVTEQGKKIWISSDAEDITKKMELEMKSSNLIVFDATFWDESVFPAFKMHHMPINKSLLYFRKLGIRTIFAHVNHSENFERIDNVLERFGFCLAKDGMEVMI